MHSPVLNRVWHQTIWFKPSSYEIFYKSCLIWLTFMLFFGFTTACLLASLFFAFLRAQKVQSAQGLAITPEGDCQYYPSADANAISCKLVSARHALFWCHLVLQSEDGKSHQLVLWLSSLSPQQRRRFSALCHNWSQEVLA
ncbi:MAG: hypothetical protein GX860_04465 [Alcaligenaceae bacterium]|nr:hypothetical protein [Alcaligenaceae bacterium]